MEWIELLKMLSDQQTNAITQRQIDALQTKIERIAAFQIELVVLIVCMIVAVFAYVVIADYLQRIKIRRSIKINQDVLQDLADLYIKAENVISQSDSIKNKNGR